MIAVLSPTYLLFIRQCRYYSLGVFFTFILFAAWSWCDSSKRIRAVAYISGLIAIVGLWFTNYLNAVAALALLPVFLAEHQYRNNKNRVFLILVYILTFLCGVYIYLWRDPLSIVEEDSVPVIYRYLALFFKYLGSLGPFEFLPILLLPILLLPFKIRRLYHFKALARRGFILIYAIFVYIFIIALFSPVSSKYITSMRYLVPLILIGATITSIILIILWNLSRWLSIFVALLTIFTNTFTLSYHYIPWRSTLLNYLYECHNDYKTSTESIIEFLSPLPPNKVVLILPPFMAYSPMFYEPELNYCCQLRENKIITPDLRSGLPIYIFTERAQPDYILSMLIPPEELKKWIDKQYGEKAYTFFGYLMNGSEDCSRPEIPFHCFNPPLQKEAEVISVYKLNQIIP